MDHSLRASVGVIGAGNSAHALAAHLSSLGLRVSMYARDLGKLLHVARARAVVARGRLEGSFPVDLVTDDLSRLAKNCSIIFLATVTTAYQEVARRLAPYLRPDHMIIPFSSKLCGSLEVERALLDAGAPRVPVIETDALFACRLQEDGSIWIRGIKGWNLYSGPRRSDTLEYGAPLAALFPGVEPAMNLIQRGLTDFGAVAHAVITLANISRIDRAESFLFYYEGLSERTIGLLEVMEGEFRAVAKAYDVELLPMKDVLDRYYGCDARTLLSAVTSVPNYRHSLAPTTLSHRYLQEDVACTLVPMRELARKANVSTPMADAVVCMASVLGGRDFASDGRRLEQLGLSGMKHEEITAWLAS